MGRKIQKTLKKPKKPKEKEIMKPVIDRIIEQRTFEPFAKPIEGCRFFRFTKPGQILIGQLGFPIPNFRQGTSYPLQLDNGDIYEIIANKLLHKQINKGDLCGKRVKIVYQGREYIWGGHYRKIFRISEIEWPTIISKQDWKKILKETAQNDNNAKKML